MSDVPLFSVSERRAIPSAGWYFSKSSAKGTKIYAYLQIYLHISKNCCIFAPKYDRL